MPLPQISMKELYERNQRLKSKELILDVRSPEEYRAGHVASSHNIPHDQVAAHVDELRKYERVYIHCKSGKRAGAAAQTLTEAGLTNLTCVTGSGMDDWTAAGFPIEKE